MMKDHLVNGSVGRVLDFVNPAEAKAIKIAGVEAGPKPDDTTKEVLARMRRWESNQTHDGPKRYWPVVRFTNGVERIITPHDFTVNNALGDIEAGREQVATCLIHPPSVH